MVKQILDSDTFIKEYGDVLSEEGTRYRTFAYKDRRHDDGKDFNLICMMNRLLYIMQDQCQNCEHYHLGGDDYVNVVEWCDACRKKPEKHGDGSKCKHYQGRERGKVIFAGHNPYCIRSRDERLKPCPFCGNEVVIGKTYRPHECIYFDWIIECKNCNVQMYINYEVDNGRKSYTKDQAIDMWNERA